MAVCLLQIMPKCKLRIQWVPAKMYIEHFAGVLVLLFYSKRMNLLGVVLLYCEIWYLTTLNYIPSGSF